MSNEPLKGRAGGAGACLLKEGEYGGTRCACSRERMPIPTPKGLVLQSQAAWGSSGIDLFSETLTVVAKLSRCALGALRARCASSAGAAAARFTVAEL